ncbi:MAG: bifunctional metallophosphatase/5'-nucleotidase [Lachnospiraceae bacterium]|nr:bifunctional metallophosphatase/5'-nucleotidase [Lachnospiraceae bacterium]
MKRSLKAAAILFAALVLGGCNVKVNVNAPVNDPAPENKSGDIVILYTNDVHCGIDDSIGYAGLAAYKKEMEDAGNTVFLVDDGDEVQGGTIGTLTKGESIIRLMNDVAYDLAIPGNHDFDYGMDQFLKLTDEADYPYICANFMDLIKDEPVFKPYIIETIGNRKIAFVGATTPTTVTSSTPAYFQDEDGEFIYGFCQGPDGSVFYDSIQEAVDSAVSEGVDNVILIAHLGIAEDDSPYRSTDVIANTTGIDAVLDGHSHTDVAMDIVKNKDGEDVVLTQAGYKLAAIGKVVIGADGKITSELIKDYDKKDEKITADIAAEDEKFEEMLGKVVGSTDHDLMSTKEDGDTWLVRSSETNMADFVADAYRSVTGAEAAIINGGGVRANIKAGDITYGDLLSVNPFSNQLCIRRVKGQELADALEFGVSFAPDDFGGFLQVSGITFDVDLGVPSPVKLDSNKMFEGFASDERRVSNIMINGEPLEPDREYEVASIEYILFNQGNGFTMFTGDRADMGRCIEDIDALIEYMQSMNGKVSEDYADISGQGRIHIKQ